MSVLTILLAILVFGLLIFVHELGHFLTAKASGIGVLEFALGMGPVLFSVQRGETRYSLRAFPIGGFCAMEGEDEESDSPRAFGKARIWKRMIVMVAGSAMNLLLGLIILFYLSMSMDLIGTTVVARFEEGATSSAHLQVGDEIVRMNGRRVRTNNDVVNELIRDRDGVMDIEVVRDGQRLLLEGVTFQTEALEGGGQLIIRDFISYGVPSTFGGAVRNAFNWTMTMIKQVWGSLVDLATGRFGLNQVSGPVGVTQAIGEASSYGLDSLLIFVALITINLGVFNLLPIPALDGGRLLFLLIEIVRRKPVPQRYEGWVTAAGFVLLIGVMIAVTLKDVLTLF